MPDSVTLRDPYGEARDVPSSDVAAYVARGYKPESPVEHDDRVVRDVQHDLYGGVGGALKTAGAGVLSGLTIGGSDALLGALGNQQALKGLQAENPVTSIGSNVLGAILPSLLTAGAAAPESAAGIGARILARSPAALVSRVGGAVTGIGEGAGALARAGAAAAGAGAEGALYGGGQYLSQVALEDKPLSAEGFVGAMGHGALFAAPVGGALSLTGSALQRARSLFPRSVVTEQAARAVHTEAADAVAGAVTDGDSMAQAIQKRLDLTEAKMGMAQAGEGVTRRMFGAADPQALGDQVVGGVDKAQMTSALQRYQASKAQLSDWIREEADPSLEAALTGMQPEGVQGATTGAGGVPTGEFGAPGGGGFKSQDELGRLASGTDAPGAAVAVEQSQATRVLRGGAQGTAPGEVPASEIVRSGPSAVESIASAPAAKLQGHADDSLESLLAGMKGKLDAGGDLNAIGAPGRAEYAAAKAERTSAAAEHFRAKANAKNFEASSMGAEERALQPPKGIADLDALLGSGPPRDVTSVMGKRNLGSDFPVSSEEYAVRSQLGKRILNARGEPANANELVAQIIGKRAGKNVDIGPSMASAAKAIGDFEGSLADLADILGPEAPIGAAKNAKAYRAASAGQADATAASAAKTAQDIATKPGVMFGGETVVDSEIQKALNAHDMKTKPVAANPAAKTVPPVAAPAVAAPAAQGALGKVADAGAALEVLKAMGVHVPGLGAIPVIGPVLSLFLKARAVMGIIGRKGGSIGKTVEGSVAAKAAEVRNRINVAVGGALEVGARGAQKASAMSAGPTVTLAHKLFPGGDNPKSKDPQVLYAARMDELARAQAPLAIDHAIGDRYPTGDPALHDALVAQVTRGIQFLDGKAPKQTVLPGMVPGDGKWQPSRAALEVFGRYVHAVNDPASVLEDVAKGHVTLEGAETLKTVYPRLYAEAQQILLQHAAQMQQTLPYPRRVAISIMYGVPVDGTMTPSHMQFLQGPGAGAAPAPAPMAPPPGAPAITGPFKIGPQTMTPLDRRAGS